MTQFTFDPGFGINGKNKSLDFSYADDCFGPQVETRSLDAIRPSLKNPNCDGPETVYAIAMDVGKKKHQEILEKMFLLYGCVSYAAGRLGDEPIRSQGHIHAISPHCGWSTPEVYEIWEGRAIIYMQEYATDIPGRCYAVEAGSGEVVIVPPNWAHATISADPKQALTFGAWCDRQYGFEYDDVRAHGGLSWFPVLDVNDSISWQRNDAYCMSELICKKPETYSQLGLDSTLSIYQQFEKDFERFAFVPNPAIAEEHWKEFIP